MNIFTGKMYDNQKGYFHIPAVWRDEYNLQVGGFVGMKVTNNRLIIDKYKRTFMQKISTKGKVTIPLEIRKILKKGHYQIWVFQQDETIILSPF